MIIRKLFKFEGAHKVFNCSSTRCKYSNHGHSYIVEVFFTANGLDNGQMIVDFGLLKGTIKEFIDSFDHAYSMWNRMPDGEKNFQKEYSERWIEMPVSPSAESYSLMFLFVIEKIIQATEFSNGEKEVQVSSVRVHETDTGYAESFIDDLKWVKYELDDIIFSEGVRKEWNSYNHYLLAQWDMRTDVRKSTIFINPHVEQQV